MVFNPLNFWRIKYCFDIFSLMVMDERLIAYGSKGVTRKKNEFVRKPLIHFFSESNISLVICAS